MRARVSAGGDIHGRSLIGRVTLRSTAFRRRRRSTDRHTLRHDLSHSIAATSMFNALGARATRDCYRKPIRTA